MPQAALPSDHACSANVSVLRSNRRIVPSAGSCRNPVVKKGLTQRRKDAKRSWEKRSHARGVFAPWRENSPIAGQPLTRPAISSTASESAGPLNGSSNDPLVAAGHGHICRTDIVKWQRPLRQSVRGARFRVRFLHDRTDLGPKTVTTLPPPGRWRVVLHAHGTKSVRHLGQSVEHKSHLW